VVFLCWEGVEMQDLSAAFTKGKLARSLFGTLQLFFLPLLVCVIFDLSAVAYCENQEKPTWVNWQNYMIGATGAGMPDTTLPHPAQKQYTLKKAREKAVELLLAAVESLNLTSNMTVEDTIASDSLLASKVEEIVKKAEEVHIRYMSDLSVEVDIQLPLTGKLANQLLPTGGGGKPVPIDSLHCPLCGQPWPPGRPFPKYLFSLPAFSSQQYTGLVVDAQGLGVHPALAPAILSEEGHQVYGMGFVDREVAVSEGIVKYSKDLQQAIKDRRVGQNPLVVKGLRATGPLRTDVTIPNATAMILHHSENNLKFLRQGKVIVVLDKD